MNEFERIATYFRPLASKQPGALNLTDDAALLEIEPGRQLVVSTDAMVEGIHFLSGTSAEKFAAKLLAVNLSDLAAMGAVPHAYLVSLALPKSVEIDWLDGFVAGLMRLQERWQIDLVGGDSVSTTGPISASVTIMGTVFSGTALRRSGATVGDDVYVTGTIGDGVLGLKAARGELSGIPPSVISNLISRYEEPTPRIDVGQSLVGVASAAIDISDGLLADLGHIADASDVGIRVLADTIPLSEPAGAAISLRNDLKKLALTGGDDYELAFSAPAKRRPAIDTIAEQHGVAITKIGEVTSGSGVVMVDKTGKPIDHLAGWSHF